MRTDEQIQKLNFGKRLKWLFARAGVRPTDVAQQLNCTRGAVSNWTAIGEISLKNAVEVSDLLGVSVNDLWNGNGELIAYEDRSAREAGADVIDVEAREVKEAPRVGYGPEQGLSQDAVEIGRAFDRLPSMGDKFKVWSLISNLTVKNPFVKPPVAPVPPAPLTTATRHIAPAPSPKPKRRPTPKR